MDRRFGGAAQGHEATARRLGPQPWRQVRGDFVTAEQHRTQRQARVGRGATEQHVQQRRHAVEHAGAVLQGQFTPARGIALRFGLDANHRRAGGQRSKQVEHRQVELQRREREDAVIGGQLEASLQVFHRVGGGQVADFHALGFASGTGGIEDVGQVADRTGPGRVQRGARRWQGLEQQPRI